MVNGNARTIDSTVLAAICKQPFLYTAYRNYLQRSWQPRHVSTLPPSLSSTQRVTNIKALGITITSQLAMNLHFDTLLESCGKTLYGLRVLRAQCMNDDCIQEVLRSIIIVKLTYASQAYMEHVSPTLLSRRSLRSVGTNYLVVPTSRAVIHSFLPSDAL